MLVLFVLDLFVLEMSVEIPAEAAGTDQHYQQVELVPQVAERFHVVAELNSHPSEEVAPDQRSNEGINKKLEQRRFQYACGE